MNRAEQQRVRGAHEPETHGGERPDDERVEGEAAKVAADDPVDLAPHGDGRLDVDRAQAVDQVRDDGPAVAKEEERKDGSERDDERDQA